MTEEQNNEDTKQQDKQIDPDLLSQVREQVLEQLRKEQEDQHQQKMKQREQEREAHQQYIERMKESDEPWVEVVGIAETEKGIRVELEWNDAFVQYLRSNGVSGTDDEQVIQRWVTLLLRDMADQMEGSQESSYE